MKIVEFAAQELGLRCTPLQSCILKSSEGEVLTDEEAALFERHAGRPWPGPGEPPSEVHIVTGRQSGKTGYVASVKALHAIMDPSTVEGLEPGYVRDVLAVAPTVRQARILQNRIRGLILSRPEIRRYLKDEPTQHELEFDFGVRLGVWAARGAHVRGVQSRLLLLDEACHLPAEGPHADEELIDAVLPGMAHVPRAQVFTISSPWVEQGYVYETWRRRAELTDELVFQAASWELNPGISQKFLERQRRRHLRRYGTLDGYRREFGGEFVGTIQAFIPSESIEACVVAGRRELPPQDGIRYVGVVDQAYRHDAFTLAIGHLEQDRIVADRLRGWAPGSAGPLKIPVLLDELVLAIAPYRVTRLLGDQYSADVFRELLRGRGLQYEERPFTSESKFQMYSSLKAGIVMEKVDLLDHPQSLRQLRTLEARATPAGNIRIEAPADDYADVLAVLAHELRPSREKPWIEALPSVEELRAMATRVPLPAALRAREGAWQCSTPACGVRTNDRADGRCRVIWDVDPVRGARVCGGALVRGAPSEETDPRLEQRQLRTRDVGTSL